MAFLKYPIKIPLFFNSGSANSISCCFWLKNYYKKSLYLIYREVQNYILPHNDQIKAFIH